MSRLIATFLLVAALAPACPGWAQSAREPPIVHVAIVTDGPSETAASVRRLFLDEASAHHRS